MWHFVGEAPLSSPCHKCLYTCRTPAVYYLHYNSCCYGGQPGTPTVSPPQWLILFWRLVSGDTDCSSDADSVNSITLFVLHNNGYYRRGNTKPAVLGHHIQCLDTSVNYNAHIRDTYTTWPKVFGHLNKVWQNPNVHPLWLTGTCSASSHQVCKVVRLHGSYKLILQCEQNKITK